MLSNAETLQVMNDEEKYVDYYTIVERDGPISILMHLRQRLVEEDGKLKIVER